MTDLAERRDYIRRFCERACNGDKGRRCSDAIYRIEITEGRDYGPKYSSCADLAHASLFAAGCRDAKINRKEHRGFVFGVNVGRLAYWPGVTQRVDLPNRPASRLKDASQRDGLEPVSNFEARKAAWDAECLRIVSEFRTGDVCAIWKRPDTTDAHVCIFDRVEGGLIHTWDAGQGPMASTAWANGADHVEIRRRVREPKDFPIKAFVPLERVPFAAEPRPLP